LHQAIKKRQILIERIKRFLISTTDVIIFKSSGLVVTKEEIA